MPYKLKTYKLIDRIEVLVRILAEHRGDFDVHRCIDQYYYIQKIEELRLINETDLKLRLSQEQITVHYYEVFYQWNRDARWLNRHLLFDAPCQQTFPHGYGR